MRIVFMGTPDFAVPVLSALLDAAYEVVGVYTRPDKPAGRGKQPMASAVKQHALARGLPVFHPVSLRPQQVQRELASLSPDVMIVAAYGLLIPSGILDLPPLGCLNIHPSLLPRYRGPSPVASAILNGDPVTGVTIIKLDEGMDTGPIIACQETPVGPQENAEDLTTRLFQMGASVLMEVLPQWMRGEIRERVQDETQATVTRRLSREDGEIDWGLGAVHIARQVLAYYPWPGSYTRWMGKLLKVIDASAIELEAATSHPPGVVVSLPDGGLGITTGEGILEVRRLQMEGRRGLGAREFAQGQRDFPGSTVG